MPQSPPTSPLDELRESIAEALYENGIGERSPLRQPKPWASTAPVVRACYRAIADAVLAAPALASATQRLAQLEGERDDLKRRCASILRAMPASGTRNALDDAEYSLLREQIVWLADELTRTLAAAPAPTNTQGDDYVDIDGEIDRLRRKGLR